MLDSSQHGTIDRRGQAVFVRSVCECYRHDGSTDRRCQRDGRWGAGADAGWWRRRCGDHFPTLPSVRLLRSVIHVTGPVGSGPVSARFTEMPRMYPFGPLKPI